MRVVRACVRRIRYHAAGYAMVRWLA